MSNFALIENNIVKNIFVCDSLENAKLIFGDNCVDCTGVHDAVVGGQYNYSTNKFIGLSPYPSWVIQDDVWVAPTPMPNDGRVYVWDEPKLQWDLMQSPYPSWIWDPVKQAFMPPVPMPSDGSVYVWDEYDKQWITQSQFVLNADSATQETQGVQGTQGVTGPTGPTGAASTVTGPTGPTGAQVSTS
jgi:hypothetical protein